MTLGHHKAIGLHKSQRENYLYGLGLSHTTTFNASIFGVLFNELLVWASCCLKWTWLTCLQGCWEKITTEELAQYKNAAIGVVVVILIVQVSIAPIDLSSFNLHDHAHVHENAGRYSDGPSCRALNSRTWNCGTWNYSVQKRLTFEAAEYRFSIAPL